ncbi:hypothetical protein N3K66_007459 [Trichothecium roseum]|uniref:Uncharacterized protein n=1 Tax=Trichothecium roseum TaxID=47278 RepID=A0ACC0UU23_9HYPO|nr:hypothetical protein N3K66_007459 [Trichothecium roseum]
MDSPTGAPESKQNRLVSYSTDPGSSPIEPPRASDADRVMNTLQMAAGWSMEVHENLNERVWAYMRNNIFNISQQPENPRTIYKRGLQDRRNQISMKVEKPSHGFISDNVTETERDIASDYKELVEFGDAWKNEEVEVMRKYQTSLEHQNLDFLKFVMPILLPVAKGAEIPSLPAERLTLMDSQYDGSFRKAMSPKRACSEEPSGHRDKRPSLDTELVSPDHANNAPIAIMDSPASSGSQTMSCDTGSLRSSVHRSSNTGDPDAESQPDARKIKDATPPSSPDVVDAAPPQEPAPGAQPGTQVKIKVVPRGQGRRSSVSQGARSDNRTPLPDSSSAWHVFKNSNKSPTDLKQRRFEKG